MIMVFACIACHIGEFAKKLLPNQTVIANTDGYLSELMPHSLCASALSTNHGQSARAHVLAAMPLVLSP